VSRLPFQVSASYELNGRKMQPTDIVGQSGLLKVTYVIKNVTTKPTTVTFKNVFGQKETRTVQAPAPMAAAFSVTLPATFTNPKAPGASANGNGDGTVTASWTMFFFNPLGGVRQAVSYQAQVTDATIPSATLEAQAIPPANLKPLPTIKEPGVPAVPTVTIGGRLASFQAKFQKKLQQIAGAASAFLGELRKVAVTAAVHVSGGLAKLATALSSLSKAARKLSTAAGDVSSRLAKHAAGAAATATMIAAVQTRLTALPTKICGALSRIPIPIRIPAPSPTTSPSSSSSVSPTPTASPSPTPTVTPSPSRSPRPKATRSPRFRIGHLSRSKCIAKVRATPAYPSLLSKVAVLETLILKLSGGLAATSVKAKAFQALVVRVSTHLATSSTTVNGLSAKAAQAAITLANVTLTPKQWKTRKIHPRQVGGGARLDAAVDKLDAAISNAAAEVDDDYAYLTALDTRAGQSMLPAGNASWATAQVGAVIYSISGASPSQHQIHLATVIGMTALTLGATFGLSLYRIRRGEPSSLAPAKT
jgi:hypothetical protein